MATTQQVQRAQAAFRACGFKRGEYTATTEQVYRGTRNGYRMFDYGDMHARVKLTLTPAIVAQAKNLIHHGYDVEFLCFEGRERMVLVKETRMPSGIGRIVNIWQDRKDANGISIRERVI